MDPLLKIISRNSCFIIWTHLRLSEMQLQYVDVRTTDTTTTTLFDFILL